MTSIEKYKVFKKMLGDLEKGHNGGDMNGWLWFCGLENNPGPDKEHNQNLLNNKDYHVLPKQGFDSKFNSVIRDIVTNVFGFENINTTSANDMYKDARGFYCANVFPLGLCNRRCKKDKLDQEI